MATVVFRFVKPNSLIGRLICWRLKEPWSHVSVLFHDTAFSAQLPKVLSLPLSDTSISIPPRSGKDVILDVSDANEKKMRTWCEGEVGKKYDYASILGFLFGWSWLQSRKNTYCFEFVHQCLEHMGWLKPSVNMIKGNRLIEDIELLIAQFVKDTATPIVVDAQPDLPVNPDDSLDYKDSSNSYLTAL